jgi:alpha-D-ribose 1-methylphosphonate 5-triphosphate synthase subunit PhnG
MNHLTTLTHAPPEAVKLLAESVIPHLEPINVLQSRTGLVMVPYTDSTQGTTFHLGEALIAEAHVEIANGVQGYAACLGRDLEQAMAVALLDAALTAGIERDRILAFVHEQARIQAEADDELLRQVEATRVEMETF